jgi:hypothetical protein
VSDWWTGLPAAETTVTCGGDTHRLRWQAGELRALDHEDAEAERTLSALGGERCTCLDTLDAWARHQDDLRVLVLASRGSADQLAAQTDPSSPGGFATGRLARGWSAYSGVGGAPMPGARVGPPGLRGFADTEDDLIALLGLGGGLQNRLTATVAAAWAQKLPEGDEATRSARPQLHAALYGRVTASLRTWLARPRLEVDLQLMPEGHDAKLAEDNSSVRAELPFGWLVDVWANDLTIIAGRFCLAATNDHGNWTLSTVGPDFRAVRPITIELPQDP